MTDGGIVVELFGHRESFVAGRVLEPLGNKQVHSILYSARDNL
jgi:hypothetical protein